MSIQKLRFVTKFVVRARRKAYLFIVAAVRPGAHAAMARSRRVLRRLVLYAKKISKRAMHSVVQASKIVHHHAARRPHHYLLRRLPWYAKWHTLRYHGHAHVAFTAVYVLGAF